MEALPKCAISFPGASSKRPAAENWSRNSGSAGRLGHRFRQSAGADDEALLVQARFIHAEGEMGETLVGADVPVPLGIHGVEEVRLMPAARIEHGFVHGIHREVRALRTGRATVAN